MSRNFIFNPRKQEGSARNLNLRCGLGASKQGFGVHRDPDAYGRGLLRSAEYCDLGARRHGLLQSTKCRDVGAGGHRLLRDAKCYDFVACIGRLFRDIGCCDLSASGYSLSQDAWRRGFIAPKYELRSRVNCDYSVSVLLNGAVCCGFVAQNSTKFSSDTYCGSSASTYLRYSSSVGACLRRVDANRDVHSRRDPSASVRLRRSYSTNGRLQSSISVRSQRNFNAGVCLRRVGTKRGVHLYCKFGANRDTFPRCGFDACGLSAQFSAQKAVFSAYRSLFCDASGLGSEPNSEASFSQSIKNSERNLPLSFLQSVKSSDQSQNSKPARAQSFKNQNFAWDFSQNGGSADPNSVQNFSQSVKNSDRNSEANSTQDRTEPVSPQELKNSEPCPAQRLGFYAPKFKDERARNFFSHPMRAFVLCACFFAALGAFSFLAPDALAIDYVAAHKFYFLFLAPSCIYAAFLLTALPDWTNFEGSLKPVSLAFAACLIAAFIASFLNLRLAAAITGLFWAVFFIFAAWLLWLDKNSNNFSILSVLAAFCACSAAYGISGDEKFLLSFVHINVAAIAVVSYRISVVIGNEALREAGLSDAVFIPNFIYKNLAAFLAFALALATPFLSEAVCGFIALGIGFLFLAKLRELHYAEILSRHYMAFYYALQAACAAGYLWLGAALIRGGYSAAPLHVIAICYIYGAILFVGMIAGQRHSGISPLNFPRLSRAALVLALLAGALRAVFAGESFVLYVMIPSALFIAAVALYLINFVPIFLKNPFSADPD
nr:NnrS family protein [uncultured Campylobacter sp.]